MNQILQPAQRIQEKGSAARTEKRIHVSQLAAQLGITLPSNGMPIVIENGSPTAVKPDDLVYESASFLTDEAGQVMSVQPMMGG
jgi:hypothetical protein